MKLVRLLAGLALALGVHALGMLVTPEFSRVLNPFLIVAALSGVTGSSFVGLGGGLLAGLTRDVLSGGLYGLHGFADTIIGYVTARIAQRLDVQRPLPVFAVVALATLAEQAILVTLTHVLLPRPEVLSPLWVLLQAGVNGLVGCCIYLLAARASGLRERTERRRMSRLRL